MADDQRFFSKSGLFMIGLLILTVFYLFYKSGMTGLGLVFIIAVILIVGFVCFLFNKPKLAKRFVSMVSKPEPLNSGTKLYKSTSKNNTLLQSIVTVMIVLFVFVGILVVLGIPINWFRIYEFIIPLFIALLFFGTAIYGLRTGEIIVIGSMRWGVRSKYRKESPVAFWFIVVGYFCLGVGFISYIWRIVF